MDGVVSRALSADDAPQVTALLIKRDRELFGQGNYWESTIRSRLANTELDLEQSSRGLFTNDGSLIGFAVIEPQVDRSRGSLWWYVDTAWRGSDVQDVLLNAGEALGAAWCTTLTTSEYTQETTTIRLLLDRGFAYRQSFYTMRLDYDGAPSETPVSVGFRLVSFAEQPTLRPYVEVEAEAFRDHWAAAETVVDENMVHWQQFVDTAPDFDPTCWWLAYHGDEPAGAIMTQTASHLGDDVAWVNSLGVLPKFQRRGLGAALIGRAISAYYERGNVGIGLGADGNSPHAVAMYQRAGLRIYQQTDSFEKALPGTQK